MRSNPAWLLPGVPWEGVGLLLGLLTKSGGLGTDPCAMGCQFRAHLHLCVCPHVFLSVCIAVACRAAPCSPRGRPAQLLRMLGASRECGPFGRERVRRTWQM